MCAITVVARATRNGLTLADVFSYSPNAESLSGQWPLEFATALAMRNCDVHRYWCRHMAAWMAAKRDITLTQLLPST